LACPQGKVAERLGADPCTITNWELHRTKPLLPSNCPADARSTARRFPVAEL